MLQALPKDCVVCFTTVLCFPHAAVALPSQLPPRKPFLQCCRVCQPHSELRSLPVTWWAGHPIRAKLGTQRDGLEREPVLSSAVRRKRAVPELQTVIALP